MKAIFNIEMLPAQDGDCLWIEYGDPNRPGRVLIDGGRGRTDKEILKRVLATQDRRVHFELLVVTHVDCDHIDGVLNLLEAPDSPLTWGDIWFNGWRHLDESNLEALGPLQGERLTEILMKRQLPWNAAFHRNAVVVSEGEPLPSRELAGGLSLTLVSPDRQKLKTLKPEWLEVCREAGLDPHMEPAREPLLPGREAMGPLDINQIALAPFEPDRGEANGSTIAFLAEFDGRRALFTGDAHSDILLQNLKRVTDYYPSGRIHLDAFKLPHHGSKFNISRELVELVDCRRYLISSSGARHGHPDAEAMSRVIKFGCEGAELVFNYRSRESERWENNRWMHDYKYRVRYPNPGASAVVNL